MAFGASVPIAARVGTSSSVGFRWHAAQCCANNASAFGAWPHAAKLDNEAIDNDVISVVRMGPPARQE
jgi:hypothetical protein